MQQGRTTFSALLLALSISGAVAAPETCVVNNTRVDIVGTKTGFFHVEKLPDGKWWMITPDGHGTFLVGCGSCWYHGSYCEALKNEPYRLNNDRKYPSLEAWGTNVIKRLKSWGFNALSGNDFLFRRGLAHADLLALGEEFCRAGGDENNLTPYEGYPCSAFPNVFSPAFEVFCRESARRRCAAGKDDPWLSGLFLDNELAWWGRDTGERGKRVGLFDAVMRKPDSHSAKQALLKFVGGRLVTDELKGEFLRLVADRYFSIVSKAVREVDPNHMIYGTRFAGFEYVDDILWETAGKYCDLLAVNVYPTVDYARNGVYSNPFIGGVPVVDLFENAHRRSGRPIVVSEWSFLGLDSKSPSTCGSGQRWLTQAERAKAAEFFARTMLSLPYVVGYDFFKHEDAPPLGMTMTCPENANFGLVDIEDNPYPEMTEMFTRIHRNVTELRKAPLPVSRSVKRKSALEICRQMGNCASGKITASKTPDGAFSLSNGLMELRGEIGGKLRSGNFIINPMMKEVDGLSPDWIEVDEIESADVSERDGAAVAEVKFRTAFRPGGRKMTTRFTLAAGCDFAAFEILSMENRGEKPIRVDSVFFRLAPEDISTCKVLEDGLTKRPREIVPGLWQHDAWTISEAENKFAGFAAVPGEKLTITFSRDAVRLFTDAEARLVPAIDVPARSVWQVPERLMVLVTAGKGGKAEWLERINRWKKDYRE